MRQENEISLVSGFINSFIFPFRPGVLLYNLIGVFLITASVFFFVSDMQSRVNDIEYQQSEIESTINRYTANPDVVRDLQKYKTQGYDDEQLASIEYQLAAEKAMQAGESLEVDIEQALPSFPWGILYSCLIAFAIVSAKNFDIAAQIADGDFDAPSLSPTKYVSPFIIFKWIGVWIVILLVLRIIMRFMPLTVLFSPALFISLILAIVLFIALAFPAMVLTLIRTNSALDTIKPTHWLETVNTHVGQLNYIILVVFLIIISVASYFIQDIFILDESAEFNLMTEMLSVFLLLYVYFHFISSNHYLMGFMTQHGTDESFKGDFGGYENKKAKQISVIDEANGIFKSGYPDDAINLLNNALTYPDTTPEEKLKIFNSLEKIYQSQNNLSQVTQMRQDSLKMVMEEAPHLKTQVIPKVLALVESGDLTPEPNDLCSLARCALDANKYDIALKMTMDLIKKNPNHSDINEAYILAGRAFAGNKNYQKAYQAIGRVFKQLDKTHPNYFDLKGELLALKRKAQVVKKS